MRKQTGVIKNRTPYDRADVLLDYLFKEAKCILCTQRTINNERSLEEVPREIIQTQEGPIFKKIYQLKKKKAILNIASFLLVIYL